MPFGSLLTWLIACFNLGLFKHSARKSVRALALCVIACFGANIWLIIVSQRPIGNNTQPSVCHMCSKLVVTCCDNSWYV